MSLWLFFIAISLLWDYRHDKKAVRFLIGYAAFSLAYFLIINMLVMPRLGNAGDSFKRYEWLGGSYPEIAKYLLTHPGKALKIMFSNTTGWQGFDGIKAEFYCCALMSGMLLTLLKPNYLLMLLPLFAQKMLSSQYGFWGVAGQYSVEFVPVLLISSFLVIIRIKKRPWRYVVSGIFLLSVLTTTFYTVNEPKEPIHPERLRLYSREHYHQDDFDIRYARHLIKQLPDDAYVCAASMFVPRLAMRDKIEDFEWNIDTEAEYVMIPASYIEKKAYGGETIFAHPEAFEVVETDGILYLFKRKTVVQE